METSSSPVVPDVIGLTSDTPETSITQTVKPRRRAKHRMIYGFAFFMDELVEWGKRRFGDSDDEEVLECYIRRSMRPLYARTHHFWRRTTKHSITHMRGPRHDESDWCLTLADNKSADTVMPLPREIIDRIMQDLQLTRDAQWRRYDGI
jgi:hypothetical protein